MPTAEVRVRGGFGPQRHCSLTCFLNHGRDLKTNCHQLPAPRSVVGPAIAMVAHAAGKAPAMLEVKEGVKAAVVMMDGDVEGAGQDPTQPGSRCRADLRSDSELSYSYSPTLSMDQLNPDPSITLPLTLTTPLSLTVSVHFDPHLDVDLIRLENDPPIVSNHRPPTT